MSKTVEVLRRNKVGNRRIIYILCISCAVIFLLMVWIDLTTKWASPDLEVIWRVAYTLVIGVLGAVFSTGVMARFNLNPDDMVKAAVEDFEAGIAPLVKRAHDYLAPEMLLTSAEKINAFRLRDRWHSYHLTYPGGAAAPAWYYRVYDFSACKGSALYDTIYGNPNRKIAAQSSDLRTYHAYATVRGAHGSDVLLIVQESLDVKAERPTIAVFPTQSSSDHPYCGLAYREAWKDRPDDATRYLVGPCLLSEGPLHDDTRTPPNNYIGDVAEHGKLQKLWCAHKPLTHDELHPLL